MSTLLNNKTQSVKSIKTFNCIDKLIEWTSLRIPLHPLEIKKEIENNCLLKYGSLLILFDPYNLLD